MARPDPKLHFVYEHHFMIKSDPSSPMWSGLAIGKRDFSASSYPNILMIRPDPTKPDPRLAKIEFLGSIVK